MNSDKIQETELLQRILQHLPDWFENNKRELPWRHDPLPYYVWVSEIMLQQTRVEAVKPYFARFVGELPDIGALASCPEKKLLKLWEGLGYYSRVRNLQKAAVIVRDQYGGVLPSDPSLLRALPGIGSYTAGAVASIAYGIPEPAVDGNVMRVLSRFTGSFACTDDAKQKRHYEDVLREILGEFQSRLFIAPGVLNQALMELGATVCVPNGAPLCEKCPADMMCRARAEGTTLQIPVRKKKKDRRIEDRTVLVVRDGTKTLIHQRPKSGLLAGLWELPNEEGTLSREEALDMSRRLGLSVMQIRSLPAAKHIFSHVEWHMTGYLVLTEEIHERDLPDETYLAVEPSETERLYSIPAAFARYAAWLNIRLGQDRWQT